MLDTSWFWDTLYTKSQIWVQIRIQHTQISIGIKFDQIIFTYSVKNKVTMLNKSWGHPVVKFVETCNIKTIFLLNIFVYGEKFIFQM